MQNLADQLERTMSSHLKLTETLLDQVEELRGRQVELTDDVADLGRQLANERQANELRDELLARDVHLLDERVTSVHRSAIREITRLLKVRPKA